MKRKTVIAGCAAVAAITVLLGTFTVYDETMAPAAAPVPDEDEIPGETAEQTDEAALSDAGRLMLLFEDGGDVQDLHALGHAVYSYKYEYYVPTAYLAVAADIRSRVINEKLPAVEEFFADLNTFYDILHSEKYSSGFDGSPEGAEIRGRMEELYDSDRDEIVRILAGKYVESLIPEYIDDRERAVGRAYEIERDKVLAARIQERLDTFVRTSGYGATGGIITALFGTREIPLDDEGGVFVLCSRSIDFGHEDEYFVPHTNRPFMEQLIYYFELRLTDNVKHLNFLADALGPDWAALMEEEYRSLIE